MRMPLPTGLYSDSTWHVKGLSVDGAKLFCGITIFGRVQHEKALSRRSNKYTPTLFPYNNTLELFWGLFDAILYGVGLSDIVEWEVGKRHVVGFFRPPEIPHFLGTCVVALLPFGAKSSHHESRLWLRRPKSFGWVMCM